MTPEETLSEYLRRIAKVEDAKKGDHPYEHHIMETIRALVKKWPNPDRLTPAKRKHITKLFRNASFASFQQR